MTPFWALIVNPDGNDGATDQLGKVPVTVGVMLYGESSVRTKVVGLYPTVEVCAAAEDRVTVVAVLVPAELVAVIEYCVAEKLAAGVPVITPVVVENDRPDGKEGEIAQEAAVPPVLVGASERIAVPVAN